MDGKRDSIVIRNGGGPDRRLLASALGLTAGLMWVLGGFGPVGAASSAPVTVTSESALRSAFSDPHVTILDVSADISLSDCAAGDLLRPASAGPITIDGSGHAIRQTCANQRVMEDAGGSLTLQNITISGGALHTLIEAHGGGIDAEGNLTLDHVTVTGNSATGVLGGRGGGAYVVGNATVTASTISDDMADGGRLIFSGLGGGLFVGGDLTMSISTVSGNTAGGAVYAGGRGGGIIGNGSASIATSIIASNVAADGSKRGSGYFGGAAFNSAVSLVNSTVTDNRAEGKISAVGGLSAAGPLRLVYDTVTRNAATTRSANVAFGPGGSAFATVIAEPSGGAKNCERPVAKSNGYNFSDDSTCGFKANGDQQSGGSPELRMLAANGGPTMTQLPHNGSPLIGAVPEDSCTSGPAVGVTSDQRGEARSGSGGCTIGAVEVTANSGPSAVLVVVLVAVALVVVGGVIALMRRRRS